MLTVYDDDDRIFEAMCAGACGYLLKKTPYRRSCGRMSLYPLKCAGRPLALARIDLPFFAKNDPVIKT